MIHPELIAQQCINQQATTPIEVARFADAYYRALYGIKPRIRQEWSTFVMNTAERIDPRNKTVRSVPVTVNGTVIPYHTIPRALRNLYDAIERHDITPDEAYQEFETIHPFIDGNGRVGHLLWAMMHNSWPMQFPPEYDPHATYRM